MKTKERKYCLTMACSALIVFCFACVALADQKADLIVEKIEIKKVAQDPPYVRVGTPTKVKYKVEIKVTVKNKAVGAAAGAFKVLLEWSDNPPAGYNYLSEGGVAALAAGASKTLTFEQWVPKGVARKYRATADHSTRIDESDETNNVNSAGYVAE